MERYFLLRDNEETGPYSGSDLKRKPLLNTDLIWLEGESTCWNHPEAFESLKDSVTKAPVKQKVDRKVVMRPSAESDLSDATTYSASTIIGSNQSGEKTPHTAEIEFKPDFEELKKKYSQRKTNQRTWKRVIDAGGNLVGLCTLLIGVMVSAFMLKKAVDAIEYEPAATTAEAQLISAETLPSTFVSHAALAGTAPKLSKESNSPASGEESDKNTLKEEITMAVQEGKTNVPLPVKNMAESASKEEDKAEVLQTDNVQRESEAEAGLKKDEEAPKEEPANKEVSKPDLQLALNSYKVGLLGGISDLELSVTNSGTKKIAKAVVLVEYLKPNGKVATTQTVEITGIAPGAFRQVPVPNSSRGVSVRYKVVNVEA